MATTRNKVMWQEGMLMRPHHFQQQQRYNDYLDNQRFRAMNDLSWGFTELTLNNELLAQGKIMIDSASGTLPDGTVFSIPDQDALPDPLHPQHFPDERSRNIYLALPVASDVRNEISDGRRIGRYRLNYADVRDLHSEEGDTRTLTLPQLTGLLFNDHTPFISEQTKQWLAASPDAKVAPVAQIGEESKAARACFAEQGLEAALRYLDMLPEGDPRDQFHRQYLAAQLTEEAGLVQLAQQQYRMLFRMGLQMMVADWEPSLLEQLEQKFTAEQ
ncbi:type VI secretion system baseplate subunit TssK [Escherichia coli]|uniref:type VI secretion system baseplate subunit TssK n=1 Tax=Escherichia coli TaxID=562 RepID=UPI00233FD8D5|nr:type VI secretion system baseplate subunit TssK [Escherichia coli]